MFKEVENKKLTIKKSKLSEVFKLTPRLREDDVKEVKAGGVLPLIALLDGFLHSYNCKTVYAGNKVIGMFGASTKYVPKGYCAIWFLGTDESENYPISFVKEGKKLIKEVLKEYSILNFVYSGNTSHIEYLKRIGLTVAEDKPVKYPKGIFYPFYKFREE